MTKHHINHVFPFSPIGATTSDGIFRQFMTFVGIGAPQLMEADHGIPYLLDGYLGRLIKRRSKDPHKNAEKLERQLIEQNISSKTSVSLYSWMMDSMFQTSKTLVFSHLGFNSFDVVPSSLSSLFKFLTFILSNKILQ